MKTEMTINIAGHKIRCDYSTKSICLTDLWISAADYEYSTSGVLRYQNNELHRLLNSKAARSFVEVCKRNGYEKVHWATGRGQNSMTMACAHFAIWLIGKLSPSFHYLVIGEFVNNRLFDFRFDEVV